MSILDWFEKKKKSEKTFDKLNIPGNLWQKCPNCSEVSFKKDLELNLMVCPHCNFHFRITSEQRLKYIIDSNSFKEIDSSLVPKDFLEFKDTEAYKDRIDRTSKKTNKKEAVLIGTASILGQPVNVGIMDFSYMGGSMGAVVGEKVTRIIEVAIENKNPLIIFTMSGGARMQEGIISLMQMAKTSAALALLAKEKVLFISVLCDPTTGGTSASFAMLGDLQLAEPGALISFAGPRVIEQTIKQKLPDGFQRSEFLLEHGMLDMIVSRNGMKERLNFLVSFFNTNGEKNAKKST